MLKRLVAAALAFLMSTAASDAYNPADGLFYFRYEAGIVTDHSTNPGNESKDITAYYVGAVGVPFSQKLPMKPQWQDDNWSVVNPDQIPAGLTFDPTTLTFTGTPTAQQKAVKVNLVGKDVYTGEQIATGSATFDIYRLPDASETVDLYAHTNKYSYTPLTIPQGIVVDHWTQFYPPPPGVQIIGNNFDGTPTKAGEYPVLLEGFDYLGHALIAYYGTYTVEDGPSFPLVRDQIKDVSYLGPANFAVPVTRINRSIASASRAKYSVEPQQGSALPVELSVDNAPYNLSINGSIYDVFHQGVVRYKAVDADGTVGYSNYFTIGSGKYYGACFDNSYSVSLNLQKYFSMTLNVSAEGTRTYSYKGTLPTGLSGPDANGVISGMPTQVGKYPVSFVIDTVADGHANPTVTCGYEFYVGPGDIGLQAKANPVDVRKGDAFSGALTATGLFLLSPNRPAINLDNPAALPAELVFDSSTGTSGTISGVTATAGHFRPHFTFKNGDGNTAGATLAFNVYNALNLYDTPARVSIRQYDTTGDLVSTGFDPMSVMPGPAGDVTQYPVATISPALPYGFTFNPNTLTVSGGTILPPSIGGYGPFTITLKDGSGDPVRGVGKTQFYIDVTPRADMTKGPTVPPTFTVSILDKNPRQPFSIVEPALANNLKLTYALNKALPPELQWNLDTGKITQIAPITQPEVFGGYTVTIIDTDNVSKTSDEFAITYAPPGPNPMTFSLPEHKLVYRLDQNGNPVSNDTFTRAPLPGGSYVPPLKYSISGDVPPGITVDANTGYLNVDGSTPLQLGDWHFTETVTDSSEVPSAKSDGLEVQVVLAGNVAISPGGSSYTVNAGEHFSTPAQTISNAEGTFTFTLSPSAASQGLTLDSSGSLSGSLVNPGPYVFRLNGTDSAGRTLASDSIITINVVGPLSFSENGGGGNIGGGTPIIQYDQAHPVLIHFPAVQNAVGNLTYVIDGVLPGTLYYCDSSAPTPLWIHYDANGVAEAITKAGDLANDALVFDRATRILAGVASQAGTFPNVTLFASDDHVGVNTAQTNPYTIVVTPAKPLTVTLMAP